MAADRIDPLTISIVVPVHDGGDDLQRCLASIRACSPPPCEVVVVDDASSDASCSRAEAAGARVLRLPARNGPAHARNRGAELAVGDVLFFVDADVALPPDATAQVLDAFQREPQLAAVFGSYDDSPAAPNFLSQYKNLLHHRVHQTSRPDASTFWAGCGAIRRNVFESVGGFDEGYGRPSIEDIELGYRLRRAGHAIRLRKSLQAKHLKRWSAASLLRSDIQGRALPWTALLLQAGTVVNDLNLQWSSRVSMVAAYGALTLLVAGWWWSRLWILAALCAATLLLLNAPLYAFFARKRGMAFALCCIPWHWLYYLYSGAAFGYGLCAHLYTAPPPRV